MPGLPSARMLARASKIVNRALQQSASIQETGVTTTCMVSDLLRPVHLDGLPSIMYPRGKQIMFPVGTVVSTGQHVVVNGIDTYQLLQTSTPDTNYASVQCVAVLIGSGLRVTNASVHFHRPSDGGVTPTIAVWIHDALDDAVSRGFETQYKWRVFFPSGTKINGQLLQEGDEIVWSGIPGSGVAPLRFVVNNPGPLPISSAFFTETQ